MHGCSLCAALQGEVKGSSMYCLLCHEVLVPAWGGKRWWSVVSLSALGNCRVHAACVWQCGFSFQAAPGHHMTDREVKQFIMFKLC